MNIGWVPSPREWSRWPEAEALLEPAAALADEPMEVLGHNHLLWAVMDGDDLIAVATARLTEDGRCEVPLIGGRDHKRWLAELDRIIGLSAAEHGAQWMMGWGRLGWARSLQALGWDMISRDGNFCCFVRPLRTEGESAIKQHGEIASEAASGTAAL